MRLLVNHQTDPAYNLALEELLASESREDMLMLWRNDNAIIVGRNQNTAAEIDADFVRENRIQVVRRMTGGGAVYHDLGNINYTIIAPGRQLEQEAFSRNAAVIVEVLRSYGLNAAFQGRNDILLDGRKVSGSAKCVLNDRTLFHGTLLFDTDLSVLTRALTPDESKIASKGIKSVRSRVANIREYLPQFDRETFFADLQNRLAEKLGVFPEAIPEKLQHAAEILAQQKYRTWEWNYGSVMAYAYNWKSRFTCGGVEIGFNVKDNLIADMKITGDFFGSRDVAELAAKFNGVRPERNALLAVIASVDIGNYIAGINPDEFISLFRV
ncbi:MAG: lipoate--protein ligase [Lentisphaerae bacterium]|nr:lipoate--protein ligase [Lentisphaerota bacterium]